MKPDFLKRRRKLKKLIEKEEVDAVLTSDHNDILYYTGYDPLREDRVYMVFPADGSPKIIVTPLENEAEVKYSNVVVIDEIKDFIDQVKRFRVLGYDEKCINLLVFNELKKLKTELKPVGKMIETPRMVKEPYEIDMLRKAIDITGKVFGKVGNSLAGKSETDVSNEIDIEFRKLGVTNSFESIISSGRQSAFVHHKPDRRIIRKSDPVIVDMGCVVNGYCSDLTRMFFGRSGPKRKKMYEDVKGIRDELIDFMREGVKFSEIMELHDGLFRKEGYTPLHAFGHGVGLSVHDPAPGVLKENVVLTVEPGIYIKNVGGFRIEDMVLIKKGKAEVLSESIPF